MGCALRNHKGFFLGAHVNETDPYSSTELVAAAQSAEDDIYYLNWLIPSCPSPQHLIGTEILYKWSTTHYSILLVSCHRVFLAIDKNNFIVLLQKKITQMYASLIHTIFHVITENRKCTLCQNYDDFLKVN